MFCAKVNGRVHRETARIPAEALAGRAAPDASGARWRRSPPRSERPGSVNTDQTIRFGSVRYSTPPGLVGREVWVRVDGEELVITAKLVDGWAGARSRGTGSRRRATRRIDLSHYPDHPQEPDGSPKPPQPQARSSDAEKAFLALGSRRASVAGRGGRERARSGCGRRWPPRSSSPPWSASSRSTPRSVSRRPRARFAEGDLLAIVHHRAAGASAAALVVADEDHSVQPGTSAWASLRHRTGPTPTSMTTEQPLMTTTATRRPRAGRHHAARHRRCPRSCSRCSSGCGCPTCADAHPRCWPPRGRNGGTPPRSCGC